MKGVVRGIPDQIAVDNDREDLHMKEFQIQGEHRMYKQGKEDFRKLLNISKDKS